MDWSKQIQDTFKIWSDSQTKMVEGVTKVVQELTTPSATTTWGDTIDRWERVSREARKMQADWTDLWIRGIAITTNNSPQMAEWTKQVRQLADIMNEYQDQYWHTWLTVLKQLDPTKMPNWVTELQPLTDSWAEHMQKAIQLQDEWLQSVVTATAN